MFKRSSFTYVSLLLLLVLMVSSVSIASAQSWVWVTSNQAVNVRSGPGVQFVVRGVMSPGTTVLGNGRSLFNTSRPCLGSVTDLDMWIRVQFGEIEGWVTRCNVVIEGDISSLPVVNATFPAYSGRPTYPLGVLEGDNIRPFDHYILSYTRENAALRDAPSLDAAFIGTIPGSEPIYVVGRTSPAGWVEVVYKGYRGWIAGHLAAFVEGWEGSVPVTHTYAVGFYYVSGLPTYGPGLLSPMEADYLPFVNLGDRGDL